MKFGHRFLSTAALTLLSAPSFALTTVYTSASQFMTHVSTAYVESFDGLTETTGSFAGSGFGYTISTPSGSPYASDDILGTNFPDEALTITFTSGNVTAVGGYFFAADLSNAFQGATMTLTLSDGTFVDPFTPASMADGFRGFASTIAISSIVIEAPGNSLYASLDRLTVGTAVPAIPEPTTWALMALGLAGVFVGARRVKA